MRHYCKFCGAKKNEIGLVKLEFRILKKSYWICREHASEIADISSIRTHQEKPVFVELFSGSGHLAHEAQQRGYKTVTVDFQEKLKPDIAIDIHNLRRNMLPGNVDVVWASVPCTVYSILSIQHHWEKVNLGYRQYYYLPKSNSALEALRILNKTISLIKQMKPLFWFIENPRGALRHLPHMKFAPFRKTVSYADYGFQYYKPTDIFTNCSHFRPIEATGTKGRNFEMTLDNVHSKFERSLLPPGLISLVFDSINFLETADTRCVGSKQEL